MFQKDPVMLQSELVHRIEGAITGDMDEVVILRFNKRLSLAFSYEAAEFLRDHIGHLLEESKKSKAAVKAIIDSAKEPLDGNDQD